MFDATLGYEGEGPRVSSRVPRDVAVVDVAGRGEPATQKLKAASMVAFEGYLRENDVTITVLMLLDLPRLLDGLLHAFGRYLYAQGHPLYLFKHLVIGFQRDSVRLRHQLPEAWDFSSRWESLQPVIHRTPMPEALMKSMVSLAILSGWYRWAAVVLIAFEGVMRIGDVLQATRSCLLLPDDMLEPEADYGFLRVDKPKSGQRGGAKVQHARLRGVPLLRFVQLAVGTLPASSKLYPFSASTFRNRWDRILNALTVPAKAGFTPGGLRGGGAVNKYRKGLGIADLLWQMRLRHATTLEHYLQEVAAVSSLTELPVATRKSIQDVALLFDKLLDLQAPGSEQETLVAHQRKHGGNGVVG